MEPRGLLPTFKLAEPPRPMPAWITDEDVGGLKAGAALPPTGKLGKALGPGEPGKDWPTPRQGGGPGEALFFRHACGGFVGVAWPLSPLCWRAGAAEPPR